MIFTKNAITATPIIDTVKITIPEHARSRSIAPYVLTAPKRAYRPKTRATVSWDGCRIGLEYMTVGSITYVAPGDEGTDITIGLYCASRINHLRSILTEHADDRTPCPTSRLGINVQLSAVKTLKSILHNRHTEWTIRGITIYTTPGAPTPDYNGSDLNITI